MPEEPESILERIETLERRVRELSHLLQIGEALAFMHSVQKDLILWLFEKTGLKEVEGLSLNDWWVGQTKQHAQTLLFQLEDKAPDAAAYLQDLVNRFTSLSKDRRGPDSPPD